MRFDAWLVGTLAHYLDGESVETAVYYRQGTCHEAGSIADEVVDGSEQLFRFGETSARSVGDDGLCAVGI